MNRALTCGESCVAPPAASPAPAAADCIGITLEPGALRHALESEFGAPGLFELVQQRCPHLFAGRAVFVPGTQLERMARVIGAVESVVALPDYQAEVLARASAIARHDPGGARGVCFGYDFHADHAGFGLIEINTNAGGAMLNAALARAQRACCPPMAAQLGPETQAPALEAAILAGFHSEWQRSGRELPLRSVAIVDEAPQEQYLYPEFLLFRQLFERHGLRTAIVDPRELRIEAGRLWAGTLPIDLVYNRLTDFMLADPANATLREAYLARMIVLTPHPRAHALYADKRNLALLTDERRLRELGVAAPTREILLQGIPHTEIVGPEHAERLWQARRRLFFKPFAGYGSRAAYRGDKLTRRVWQEILAGGYVAQALVAPGVRARAGGAPAELLKFDVRNFVYDGAVQWVAARLYQGQTTNFRTPGGGYAPVFPLAPGAAPPQSADGCEAR